MMVFELDRRQSPELVLTSAAVVRSFQVTIAMQRLSCRPGSAVEDVLLQ